MKTVKYLLTMVVLAVSYSLLIAKEFEAKSISVGDTRKSHLRLVK